MYPELLIVVKPRTKCSCNSPVHWALIMSGSSWLQFSLLSRHEIIMDWNSEKILLKIFPLGQTAL